MSLLQSFIDKKTGLMSHKYHLLNQLQVFMRYKKITKMSFNIPLKLINVTSSCYGYWRYIGKPSLADLSLDNKI